MLFLVEFGGLHLKLRQFLLFARFRFLDCTWILRIHTKAEIQMQNTKHGFTP